MSSSMTHDLENFRIPLEEIKVGTNNFSQENYIGGGGFGKVYKGKLSGFRTDSTAAIKRLDPDGLQGKQEFFNELSMLLGINHKNIIKLIGFCDEDPEMILVYEYAINESLDHHLRDSNKLQCLTWIQRLKICIGAAQGLNYLHSGLGPHHRIIHRDVKSANILLNHNLEPKISDFGLSRVGFRNQPYTQLYTAAAGTRGYCDPNCYKTSILTKESDVYSFGVVLFEMLTGRLVFSKMGHQEEEEEDDDDDDKSKTLVELVQCYYEERLEKIIDSHIRDEIDPISLNTFKKIAYQCLENRFKKRPTMTLVIDKLEEALKSQEGRELDKACYWDKHFDEIHNWDKVLPHDCEKIIKMAHPPVVYNNKRELYSLLSAGILIDGGTKWFSLSKLNGKNCLSVSAMLILKECLFGWIFKEEMNWKSIPRSRFSMVAEFKRKKDFTNKMCITTPTLSLNTTYAVFVICKYTGEENRPHLQVMPLNECYYGSETLHITSVEKRDDGWMEMELFHFTNHLEAAHFEFRLHWKDFYKIDGLYVEGIDFRPIEMDTNLDAETKVELLKSKIDGDWEQKLPNDYDEIVKRSSILDYTTKKQLYSRLTKGIFIDDNSMWFWLEASNAKKCIMLSTKRLMIKHLDGIERFITSEHSRFLSVTEFSNIRALEIKGKIKAHMLSPKTPYAAWLVYKASNNEYKLLSSMWNIASLTLGKQEETNRFVYLGPSSANIRPLNDPKYKEGVRVNTINKRKLDKRARERDDGWMEVELFPFFNDMEANSDVELRLEMKNKSDSTHKFIVQGIEFRPQ